MRFLGTFSATLLLAVGLLAAPPADTDQNADASHIARLVQQLGSRKFIDREAATRALDKIGVPALTALETATHSRDAEVRNRAESLVKTIRQRAETEAALAPERIHLVFKDTPVEKAVAEFARQSHYKIQLVGDKSKLADRKVTLDTGKTTFWRAFDQFCDRAQLVEAPAEMSFPRPRSVPMKRVPLGAAVPAAPMMAPMMMKVRPGFGVSAANGVLQLADGKPKHLPTSYFGAVRVRADSADLRGLPSSASGVLVGLEVTPEPHVRWQVVQNVRINQAVDDNAQTLTMATPNFVPGALIAPPPPPGFVRPHLVRSGGFANRARLLVIRLKPGTKPSKMLKQIKGTITASVRTQDRILLSVDDVLKAVNKPATSDDGGSLKVTDARTNSDGTVSLSVELTRLTDVMPGIPEPARPRPPSPKAAPVGGVPATQTGEVGTEVKGTVRLPPAPTNLSFNGLALLDAKGAAIPLQVRVTSGAMNGQRFTQQMSFIAHPAAGQVKPARLVFAGSRAIAVTVPFDLKDVPVP